MNSSSQPPVAIKRIAALTMVRNDDMFLRKWVEYYASQLGCENLYVYFDGEDQTVPDFCTGVNTKVLPRAEGNVVQTDRARARFLSGEASRLMAEGYDMALGTDVDEFLIVDPLVSTSLAEYLSALPQKATYSGLGVDVGQVLETEKELDPTKPFLRQRSRGWLYSRYTKATVVTRPVVWGSGFHRVKGHNFHIMRDLYLFHLGGIDFERIRRRSLGDSDLGAGWDRHLKKRARTILNVSRCNLRPWTPTVQRVRLMQQWLRPLFAWNKPTTLGIRYIVQIPERFKKIL